MNAYGDIGRDESAARQSVASPPERAGDLSRRKSVRGPGGSDPSPALLRSGPRTCHRRAIRLLNAVVATSSCTCSSETGPLQARRRGDGASFVERVSTSSTTRERIDSESGNRTRPRPFEKASRRDGRVTPLQSLIRLDPIRVLRGARRALRRGRHTRRRVVISQVLTRRLRVATVRSAARDDGVVATCLAAWPVLMTGFQS